LRKDISIYLRLSAVSADVPPFRRYVTEAGFCQYVIFFTKKGENILFVTFFAFTL